MTPNDPIFHSFYFFLLFLFFILEFFIGGVTFLKKSGETGVELVINDLSGAKLGEVLGESGVRCKMIKMTVHLKT